MARSCLLVCGIENTGREENGAGYDSPAFSLEGKMFVLPKLPYKYGDLEPFLSKEQVKAHYKGHHAKYYKNLNAILDGKEVGMTLENFVRGLDKEADDIDLYHNAAQAWNHDFYWQCLSPRNQGWPREGLYKAIVQNFGTMNDFKYQFTTTAMKIFGSGWCWLVKDKVGTLLVLPTANADCPSHQEYIPLLTLDLWEHAYYCDYRWKKIEYIHNFFNHINWRFAEGCYQKVP